MGPTDRLAATARALCAAAQEISPTPVQLPWAPLAAAALRHGVRFVSSSESVVDLEELADYRACASRLSRLSRSLEAQVGLHSPEELEALERSLSTALADPAAWMAAAGEEPELLTLALHFLLAFRRA